MPRKTGRRRSSRWRSSTVGPSKRISPRSMKKHRCGQAYGAVDALLDQDHRGALLVDASDHGHEDVHGHGRQPEGELVDEQEPGTGHHDPGQGEHLLLPARERPRGLVQTGLEHRKGIHGLGQRAGGPGAVTPQDVSPDAQVVAHRQPREGHLPAHQQGHALFDDLLGFEVGRVHAEDPHDAPVRVREPRHGPEQRGLPGSVGAQEGHHLALLDLQVHIEEHLVGAVVEVEVVHLQGRDRPAGLAPFAFGVALDHVLDDQGDVTPDTARAQNEEKSAQRGRRGR